MRCHLTRDTGRALFLWLMVFLLAAMAWHG